MKKFLTLCLFVCFTFITWAQDKPTMEAKKQEFKAAKVAYITQALDLTPAEAQKFWPVYNSYQEQQAQLRKMSGKKNTIDKLKNLSDKEADVLLQEIEDKEDRIRENRKKMVKELKTVISSKKVLLLQKAEEDFNRKLLQQYRKKK